MQGNVILVAGSAGRIGFEVTKQLLLNGATVIAVDRNLELLEESLSLLDIEYHAEQLKLFQLDLADSQCVESFFSQVEPLSGAVNASYPTGSNYGCDFLDVSLESFNSNVGMLLGTSFLFSQQCIKHFKRYRGEFSLVNLSSVYGVISPKFELYDGTGMTMPVEYAAAKSALIHLNGYISKYVNDPKFRVNTVSPGGILDNQPLSFLESYQGYTRGKGMLAPENVVGAILFLLSDKASFVTGQNITVDDGFVL